MRTLIILSIFVIGAIAQTPKEYKEEEIVLVAENYTDYQCVNDCIEKGYMWALCKKQCSY